MRIEFSEDEQVALLVAIECILHSLGTDYQITDSEKIKAEKIRFETLRTKIRAAEKTKKC